MPLVHVAPAVSGGEWEKAQVRGVEVKRATRSASVEYERRQKLFCGVSRMAAGHRPDSVYSAGLPSLRYRLSPLTAPMPLSST